METIDFITENENDEKFKSYYVVWKPEKIVDIGEKKYKFKSYYVVWKLWLSGKGKKRLGSLNRTMQYGNSFFSANIQPR